MKITFGDHALDKIEILRQHEIKVTKEKVRETIEFPLQIRRGRKGRIVYESILDERHKLRVIVETLGKEHIKVITLYPTRRERYENKL